ncbi:Bifunctional enzyme NodQ (Includes: Sulfate adenylyltransferase subunit 1; Adenylyl-sulfate kinase) [uncultured delta proteobacterium]|uniref:Adenylyl-sulfate kinase n=1 Tax=uncultured delta proteobacterium TaxID=34034 RepID=A0A212JWN3_9DELT|nr:Bifunctional enzyme NodQ (Includes: Sulfate adenylyltransferase subunit 1; Adenylyl-sulfate kinase) [uncultured delta proteobacterium]
MPQEKPLLRLLSCGSVDDGKSTLIGRILHDCGILYEDQLTLLGKERTPEGLPDFSALLDGLLAEREQAITIDLAYRTFRTATRRYLVADAPGHEQYTRNMVTGASRAEVALLLIDAVRAKGGLLPQTLRHTMVASLMGIPHMVVAVNKMDSRGYEQAVFTAIEKEYLERIAGLHFVSLHCVPVSALRGDNVCYVSQAMPWYKGPTLLDILENLEPARPACGSFRLPVQWVARTPEFRGLTGTILSGTVTVGQKVALSPSGLTATVKRLSNSAGDRKEVGAEEAVCLQLTEDLDVGRGEVLSDVDDRPEVGDHLAARLVWFDEAPLVPGRTYLFRQASASARATMTEISAKISLETLGEIPAKELRWNDVGIIKLRLDRKLALAPYAESRDLGGFILIDPINASTLGAGLIDFVMRRSHNIHPHNFSLNAKAQALQKGQTPRVLWFMGLSASGKSTLAERVANILHAQGRHVYILDGDNLRNGLNQDLGFSEAARAENIRRAAEVAKLMTEAGLIVLASFISPYKRDRQAARSIFPPGTFLEIFVDTPLSVCVARDPKGLYAQALDGRLPNFTGLSAPFEAPEQPELHLDGQADPDDLTQTILDFLERLDTQ